MPVAPTVRYCSKQLCSDLDVLFIESYIHRAHSIRMVLQATIAKGYKVGLVLVTWCSELTHLSFYFDIDYIFGTSRCLAICI